MQMHYDAVLSMAMDSDSVRLDVGTRVDHFRIERLIGPLDESSCESSWPPTAAAAELVSVSDASSRARGADRPVR